jgi:hypothetical protein
MNGNRAAGRIFRIAAVYGAIVLAPLYFIEPFLAAAGRPVTHPEYLYGFVGAGLASQLFYWTIGGDPVRYRPLMPLAVVAKLAFVVPVAILFALGRIDPIVLAFASMDLLIATGFALAWRISRT